ncbi:hypothetical protein JCM13580A_17640 [Streptomyces drozdowiczii]
MWGKGTPRYRVAARGGETHGADDVLSVAYRTHKLTYLLTVPTAVTARDREWGGAHGGQAGASGPTDER